MLTIHAFGSLPPFAVGLSRDLRALWAAEESGLPYEVNEIDAMQGAHKQPDFLRLNPFGKLPVIEDEGLVLFESGAIALHVAERSGRLMPADAVGRAKTLQWAFALMNTVEPAVMELSTIDFFNPDEAWAKERRPAAVKEVEDRLSVLEETLATTPYLAGDEFTAADILLSHVLRAVAALGLLEAFPNLAAHKARCEARPAWTRVYSTYEKRFAA